MVYILHLSDLHFGTLENAEVWANQLASDLGTNNLNIVSLDALIISGDITNKCTSDEYQAAYHFLSKFRKEFPLNDKQIIIVPGNHDVNWDTSQDAYEYIRRDKYTGSKTEEGKPDPNYVIDRDESVLEVLKPAEYKNRFKNFCDFYQRIKPSSEYPLEYGKQYTIDVFPSLKILILGLNSAWQLDHYYKSRASIHMGALSKALAEIRRHQEYTDYLKIAVWHHPLSSPFEDRIKDKGFLEQLATANFRLFLHGHIHKAETDQYRYEFSAEGRKLDRICAGTFGAPTKELVSAFPWQYNLLKFEGDLLTVYTRRREEENGSWKPDYRWGIDAQTAVASYTIPLSPRQPAQLTFETQEETEFGKLQKNCRLVLQAITKGQLVPFLGADLNLCDRPKATKPKDWDLDKIPYPPSNEELAAYLDKECDYCQDLRCPLCDEKQELPQGCPIKDDEITKMSLGHVALYYDLIKGTGGIWEILGKLSQKDYAPNRFYSFFANLPRILQEKGYSTSPFLIVTTNFDRTLEIAFETALQPFDLIYYEPNIGRFLWQKFRKTKGKIEKDKEPITLEKDDKSGLTQHSFYPRILKLYGSINQEDVGISKFVITEDHYIDYLAQSKINELLPTSLFSKLKNSHILFLGYSLAYWNLRVILHRLWSQKPLWQQWAVQAHPGTIEQKLWEQRANSDLIPTSLEKYITELDRQLQELSAKEVYHGF